MSQSLYTGEEVKRDDSHLSSLNTKPTDYIWREGRVWNFSQSHSLQEELAILLSPGTFI